MQEEYFFKDFEIKPLFGQKRIIDFINSVRNSGSERMPYNIMLTSQNSSYNKQRKKLLQVTSYFDVSSLHRRFFL